MKTILVVAFVLAAGSAAAQTQPESAARQAVERDGVPILSGVVKDAATGKPAAGIRVEVDKFSAAITDTDGKFSLKVPSLSATVIVSGEGYDTRQVPLKGRKSISVSLQDVSHQSFSETVTLPTGNVPKTNVTASVTQYNVDPWVQHSETPDAMLQGRIPGLNAIRRSGVQGAGANLFLRGASSLYATNKPLIVIDNMLYDNNDYGQSIIANNYTNPLALIDPKDIENVTVIRDASSIYGTKGANGAILITTSRAKEQATRISFGAFAGYNSAPKRLPVMNAADYRIYLSEMLQSKGLTSTEIAALPYMNDNPSNPDYASYHYNTDWQDQVFQGSMTNNYYLKVTGGDNIATYGLSVGATNNQGTVRTTDLSRYNTRFNAEFNFTRKFTGYANLAFTYNEQNLKDQGIADQTAPIYLSLIKSPFLTTHVVNAEGVRSPNLADKDTLGISNPAAVINNMQAYNRYYRFLGSFGFKYDFDDSWSASTLFSVMYDKVRENIFVPSTGVAKDTLSNAIARNRLGSQVKRIYSMYSDSRISYKKNINNTHNISANLGLRYQKNTAEQDYALGYNSATDELVSVQNGLAALRQIGGGIGEWNWMSVYLNADYGFLNKYFLSFNVAADGSSRFGREAKNGIAMSGIHWPVMPSIGAAWLISSEDFMQSSSIDLLKLRATYSLTGNDDIGNYTARQTYGSQNLLGMQGLVRNGIANPALQWETVKKLNAGLDLALFNERVSLSADVFQNRTSNMLVYENIASPTGFATILTNNGGMKTTGYEAALNVRVVNRPKLKWDVGVNMSTYKNRVTSVPNGRIETEYAGATLLTIDGYPASQFYGYKSNGVFSTQAEADAANLRKRNNDGSFTSFAAGDVHFEDVNNDGIIDASDRVNIGNPTPDYTGGVNTRVIWDRFELNALFTFSKGNSVYNYTRARLEAAAGVENQLLSVNNRWRYDGQTGAAPKATWGDPMGNGRFSDRWIEDGSYFRLRSLSLQYYIPLKNMILKSASVYATGNNLFTLSKYKGFDPEFSAGPSLFAQGIDMGLDPLYRNITLGVRIGL
ncbi:SusC/RagA family TonB-linked outer membrane protein [Chitinophaga horti]|uniref:SusC/RagA family TonB-linked outer membrane protein n=1 Tax=Chitinophaga horti TaxID=2920382 RepID=A0ABY6J2Z7_9BACT|nr:SusC/RagA family TonB-linked outer membrane protein [Chitinophaga horti]UYQ94041.1 SusC/RagA family TonB-linked outer membrane protein [Chitinophaga horti]